MSTVVHVREADPGDGRGTVVLLHGLTDSGACWADALTRWSGRGWRLLAPDLRGHGRSPRWDEASLARRPGEVMVADVLDLLAGVLVDLPGPAALVGHSMGAAVAVAAAAAATGPVADAVVGVVAEDPPWPLPPITAADPVRARAYLAGHREDLALGVAGRLRRKREETPHWPAAEVGPLVHAVEEVDEALLATGDIVPPTPWPDLLAVLAGRGTPVLVLTGTGDVRVPPESEAEARRAGADVVRVEGAGHCVRRDRPAQYHAVVDPALERWLG